LELFNDSKFPLKKESPMRRYYVGMDVHGATITVAVLNGSGKLLSESVIETSTQAVRDLFQSLRAELHVTFEEGNHAAWLFDVVEPLVGRLVVCNPRHNHLLKSGSKSDRIDARKLAELLRLNALKPVYHGEQGTRTLKEVVRAYECIVKDLTRVQNRLKALYNSQAVHSRGAELYQVSKRQSWINKLEQEGRRTRAELLFLQMDELKALKRRAKKVMIAESRRHPAHSTLSHVPELGPVRVAQIIATVDSPFRFRTKRPFWTYLGLAVKTRSSSDYEVVDGRMQRRATKRVQTRGLNENYNRRLKNVFKSAATHACSCGVYKEYYMGLLTGGMRPEMARLAVARKLAAAVLAVWKSGEIFDARRIMSREETAAA
jgi:transposase